MDWIPSLSTTPLALIIIGAIALCALVGQALFAKRLRRAGMHEQIDNGAIAGLIAAIVGIFAIAAGLTAVAGWGNTVDAATRVGREASAITVLYHALGAYPEPLQSDAKKQLKQYINNVIDKEWPILHRGGELGGGVDVLANLQRDLFTFEPTTEGQKITHAEALTSFNRLLEMRRSRVQSADDSSLPAALWIVVILLGAIAIAGCFLLHMESFWMHTVVTMLVAAPIALVLFFIAVTDRPYRGGITVSAAPYRAVIEHVIAVDEARRARK
jgi:hypothetical protein